MDGVASEDFQGPAGIKLEKPSSQCHLDRTSDSEYFVTPLKLAPPAGLEPAPSDPEYLIARSLSSPKKKGGIFAHSPCVRSSAPLFASERGSLTTKTGGTPSEEQDSLTPLFTSGLKNTRAPRPSRRSLRSLLRNAALRLRSGQANKARFPEEGSEGSSLEGAGERNFSGILLSC